MQRNMKIRIDGHEIMLRNRKTLRGIERNEIEQIDAERNRRISREAERRTELEEDTRNR